jgi:parvulin-like peptidyl-prolyl isomerase
MPKTPLRLALALSAFFVVALVVAACGSSNSLSGDAVANVGGTQITKAEFNRWVQISAKSAAATGAPVVVPDPPSYTKCVAALRQQQKPVKGQPAPSVATLRAQCKAQDQQLTQQTMGTLIQTAWVEGEAKKQGVTASDAEVNKQLEVTKKQSFPTAAAYNRFVKQSGMTQAEILERVKVQLLAQKITKKVQASSANVTSAQISHYYNTHKSQFAVPERRDLEIILTKAQAQAQAAKSAVQSGTSWKAAAKKYSIDPASKATGGVLRGVAKGQEDRALDQAAFSAKKGQIVGPVKGQFGWYVVRVMNITAPQQQSLAQATPQIKALLTQQGSQQKMSAFIQDFQKRWKAKTKCRAGYVVQLCSNAPTPKTTSTAGGTVATTPPSTTRTK